MQPPWHWLHSGRNTQRGYWGLQRMKYSHAIGFVDASHTLGQFLHSKCRRTHKKKTQESNYIACKCNIQHTCSGLEWMDTNTSGKIFTLLLLQNINFPLYC